MKVNSVSAPKLWNVYQFKLVQPFYTGNFKSKIKTFPFKQGLLRLLVGVSFTLLLITCLASEKPQSNLKLKKTYRFIINRLPFLTKGVHRAVR